MQDTICPTNMQHIHCDILWFIGTIFPRENGNKRQLATFVCWWKKWLLDTLKSPVFIVEEICHRHKCGYLLLP